MSPRSDLGVKQWHGVWIVTLPCDSFQHRREITAWIQKSFGSVDPGVIRSYISQDYWFKNQEDAVTTWLTWMDPNKVST